MNDVNQLLREYATNGSEAAFRELVMRYVDLVYSAALRRTRGDTHRAEEVTQTVFTDLARKAATLPERIMLGGWLHRHTGFVASNLIRGEIRRQAREKEAATMMIHESDEASWQELAPMLDEAIDQLEGAEREAIVLRYFERRDLKSLGAVFGVSEDAAQKRVSRAVDKLRELLVARGMSMTAALLGTLLAERAVMAGPAGLAASVSSQSLKDLAPAGLVAAVAGLLSFSWFKVLAVALAGSAVIGVVQWKKAPVQEAHGSVTEVKTGPLQPVEKRIDTAVTVPLVKATPVELETAANAVKTNFIHLKLLAADSNKPVPNVQVDIRWIGKNGYVRENVQGNHLGEVNVPVSKEMETDLKLVTQLDGFASTSLHWLASQGDSIPETYIVLLERAVPIGGRVVDENGEPISGATVSFWAGIDPKLKGTVQTHEFEELRAATDTTGRWRIDRIAKDMLSRISSAASHPDHVGVYARFDADAVEKLKNEVYVTRMGKAVTVRGLVVNLEGEPVAKANVLVGLLGEANSRKGETQNDGRFVIPGCKPGKSLLTVEAKGFAAVTEEMVFSDESSPARVVLKAGKTLILLVQDQAGNPIPEANLFVSALPSFRPGDTYVPTQVEFSSRADKSGRIIWEHAPDNELRLNIGARGTFGVNDYKVRPDSMEQVVTLKRSSIRVEVQGEVRDSETGELIPKFRIIIGSPSPQYPKRNEITPVWSNHERHWNIFSQGKFKLPLYEGAISGLEKEGYLLKFEAEGYASHITGIIPADSGKVDLNIKMRKAANQWILARLPDGSPAKGIEVGLISPGAGIALTPGELKGSSGIKIISSFISADQKGLIELKPDTSVTKVVAVHEAGYAEVSIEELKGSATLELKPWGRIEGVLLKDGNPLAGADIQIDFENASHQTLQIDRFGFLAKTDEQGRFVIPKAPFGRLKMFHRFHMVNSYSDMPLTSIEVRSGETNLVKLVTKYGNSW